jgi:hypothetical protein
LTFDLARALRRIRPQRKAKVLSRRDDARLPFVDVSPAPGSVFLLDTCVYLDAV